MTSTTDTAVLDWTEILNRPAPAPLLGADLAAAVTDRQRALAGRSPEYAATLAGCPGVRLAGQFRSGMVAAATPKGVDALRAAYDKLGAALAVEPGLDRNEFIDRITGRHNPRLDHVTPQPRARCVAPRHAGRPLAMSSSSAPAAARRSKTRSWCGPRRRRRAARTAWRTSTSRPIRGSSPGTLDPVSRCT